MTQLPGTMALITQLQMVDGTSLNEILVEVSATRAMTYAMLLRFRISSPGYI